MKDAELFELLLTCPSDQWFMENYDKIKGKIVEQWGDPEKDWEYFLFTDGSAMRMRFDGEGGVETEQGQYTGYKGVKH